MATPDIRNLYERYLQIVGGQSASPEPNRSELSPQVPGHAYVQQPESYGADDRYTTTGGGVLGGLASSAPPWWAQALAPPGGVAAGPRGAIPIGRGGRFGFPPVFFDSNKLVEIPNPHLERFIPQSTRDFWTAATLLPRILGRGTQDENERGAHNPAPAEAPSSRPPLGQPPRGGGSQPPWIVGPAVLQGERKQLPLSDRDRNNPREPDPNYRGLTRVRQQGTEGDDIVNELAQYPEVGEDNPPAKPGSPLRDDHLDIPEFLRRQSTPESSDSNREKKWTDLPSADFRGGGNYNGNRGGGRGGGNEWSEECKKERKWARDICIDAYGKGLIGDVIKRWNSNYDTGPYKKEFGRWTIDDCKRGLISKDCGGNRIPEPPPPEVKRYNLRPRRSRKKASR